MPRFMWIFGKGEADKPRFQLRNRGLFIFVSFPLMNSEKSNSAHPFSRRRRWLSYWRPVLLEATRSPHNPLLEVVLNRGRVQLNAAEACYSFETRYASFAGAFRRWSPEPNQIEKALILGGGLCSIPQLLIDQFGQPQAYFDVVEIDPKVVDLARRYTPPDTLERCRLVVDSAQQFIASSSENANSYDLICIDVFIDFDVPKPLLTPEFLEQTSRLLTPKGTLLFSHMAHTRNYAQQVNQFFSKTFRSVFPNGKSWTVGHNRILVNQ